MLLDSLEYYATLSQAEEDPDHGVQNVDSAIRNLALIGVAIPQAYLQIVRSSSVLAAASHCRFDIQVPHAVEVRGLLNPVV